MLLMLSLFSFKLDTVGRSVDSGGGGGGGDWSAQLSVCDLKVMAVFSAIAAAAADVANDEQIDATAATLSDRTMDRSVGNSNSSRRASISCLSSARPSLALTHQVNWR